MLRQHSRIDLSLLQHQFTGLHLKRSMGDCWREAVETAGRCQSPMTSEEWQWIEYCRTFLCSVTQAAKGSWREAGETTCRTLPCSAKWSQWTVEDLERHGRPCRHYWLHLQNQSDVWGSIMTGFPPVAESPTPEVPCQLSHPPPPPPPPPPHAPT